MSILKSGDKRLFERIQNGDESATQQLYQAYTMPFRNWVRKTYPGFPEEEIKDIYQESFLTMYFQIRDGSIQEIRHSLKTYLFAIGKNKLRNSMRKMAKFQTMEEEAEQKAFQNLSIDFSLKEIYQKTYEAAVVDQLLKQIGEPCKTVIELAFFHQYPPESIARHMAYKNEATARVRKVRCLQQLGKMLDEKGIKYSQIFE